MSGAIPTAGNGGNQVPNGLDVTSSGSTIGLGILTLDMGGAQSFSVSGSVLGLSGGGGGSGGSTGVYNGGTIYPTLATSGAISATHTGSTLVLSAPIGGGSAGVVFNGTLAETITISGNLTGSLTGSAGAETLAVAGGGINLGGTVFPTLATAGNVTASGSGGTLTMAGGGIVNGGTTYPTLVVEGAIVASGSGNVLTLSGTGSGGTSNFPKYLNSPGLNYTFAVYPTVNTAIPGLDFTISGGSSAKIWLIDSMIGHNGNHGNFFIPAVDGTVSNVGGLSTSVDSSTWQAAIVGAAVTVPGDNAAHTVQIYTQANDATYGCTILSATMVATEAT